MKDIDLWAAEKCKDALRHCRDLAEIYPPDRGVLAGLHEGMEIIREVLQKIPDHREALNIYCRILLKLGWFAHARAAISSERVHVLAGLSVH